MAMIRWEPVGEVQTIQNEMNRLVNTLFDAPGQATRPNSMRRWIPSIDLVETAENYVLRADLPGVAEGDVKIEIEGKLLTISGERNPEHEEDGEGYYRLERPCGATRAGCRRRVTQPAISRPPSPTKRRTAALSCGPSLRLPLWPDSEQCLQLDGIGAYDCLAAAGLGCSYAAHQGSEHETRGVPGPSTKLLSLARRRPT